MTNNLITLQHILETVTVGSREMIRKQATYTQAYSYLMTAVSYISYLHDIALSDGHTM